MERETFIRGLEFEICGNIYAHFLCLFWILKNARND